MNVRKRNARVAANKRSAQCLEYLASREQGKRIKFCPNDVHRLPSRLPYLWEKKSIEINDQDKIFSALWVSKDDVLIGAKCNHLSLVNTRDHTVRDIPLIDETESGEYPPDVCGSGIHAIQMNPSGTLLATGGKNVTTIGVYRLPEITAHCVLQKHHKNGIFDLRWIDDVHLVSCSRDSTMAIWQVPCDEVIAPNPGSSITIPPPSLNYASVNGPTSFAKAGDRLRTLEFLPSRNMLATVSLANTVLLYDIERLFASNEGARPLRKIRLTVDREAVALRRWPTNPHIVSLATQRAVLLFDVRCQSQVKRTTARAVQPPGLNSSCIRSLNFNDNILSYGTSAGRVYFYDLTADKHLPDSLDMTKDRIGPNPCNCEPTTLETMANLADESLPLAGDADDTGGLFFLYPRTIRRRPSLRIRRPVNLNSRMVQFMHSVDSNRAHTFNDMRALAQAIHDRVLNTATVFPAGGAVGDGSVTIPDHTYTLPSTSQGPTNSDEILSSESSSSSDLSDDEEEEEVLNLYLETDSPSRAFDAAQMMEDFGFHVVRRHWSNTMTVYTHEYDPTGTRLFAAGGPIAASDVGNFAVLWE